jgi:putative transposase
VFSGPAHIRKRAIGMRPRIEAVPSVATAPNERWSTDLARVWTGKDGWASLAFVGETISQIVS